MSVQMNSKFMSLSGIRTWGWRLHVFFLTSDIDLLDDTIEMPASLMFSCLNQQYRLFGTIAVLYFSVTRF